MFRTISIFGLALLLSGCFQAEFSVEILSPSEGRTTTTISMSRAVYDQMTRGGGPDSRFCDLGEISLTDTDATCVLTKQTALSELTLGYPYFSDKVPIRQLSNRTYRIAIPLELLMKMTPDDFDLNDPNSSDIVTELFKDVRLTVVIKGAKILTTNMQLNGDQTSASFGVDVSALMLQGDDLPSELTATILID